MDIVRVATSSRLHFGLLARGEGALRQNGGVGLMVAAPGLEIEITKDRTWGATGALSMRALRVVMDVNKRLKEQGLPTQAANIRVLSTAAEHTGLGTGTQLHLAAAAALLRLSGQPDRTGAELAQWTGRGGRSGIGVHGFTHGGLIVDGGHRTHSASIPPLLAQMPFPEEWSVLLVIPPLPPGLHGGAESRAFAQLPEISGAVTDRLCSFVLMGLLPAVKERDLPAFGAALNAMQTVVGETFAPAQSGTFAHPLSHEIAQVMTDLGLCGVGQSSWGPTLYGFTDQPDDGILQKIRDRFNLRPNAVFWTQAANSGAVITTT